MSRHTKGPWKIERYNGSQQLIYPADDALNGSLPICVIRGPDSDANAQLIKTAPELLEALQTIRDWANNVGTQASPHAAEEAWEKVNDAIANAGGSTG